MLNTFRSIRLAGLSVGKKFYTNAAEGSLGLEGSEFRVLFIGAGNVNFGSVEGPWNHSQRLERLLGKQLHVVGIVDPATDRASQVLSSKRSSLAGTAYQNCSIFPTISAAVSECSETGLRPHAIFVGCPPAFRGTTDSASGSDIECQLVAGFPQAGLLVEKPVSAGPVKTVTEVGKVLAKSGVPVSVGYMLRYGAAVRKMKEILEENNLAVMMTSARYVMAYEHSLKPAWWNKAIDCGPIVEQATHFVDLSRYFGGEVKLNSIAAHSVEWYETPGNLSKMPIDESLIPPQERIPRFTSASWKYESGAIGHLEHGVALQGTEFSTELTVFADGYQLKLSDPYNRPTLYIRRPGSDAEEVQNFHDDDPFFSEVESFCGVIQGTKPREAILSSFEDAVETYAMTWAIRNASEKSRSPPPWA